MNSMYYILIGVIVLVVAIDFYLKNKKKKSDATDIDFPEKTEKSNNILIISVGSLLVVLIIGFFVGFIFKKMINYLYQNIVQTKYLAVLLNLMVYVVLQF